MTPLTQQVNSQPQASSWATGSGHEHLMCCHTPITNTEPGNECVKERIVIWTHWKRESSLIWHQGVPNCSFPCSVTLIKLLHLSRLFLPSAPSCTACLLFLFLPFTASWAGSFCLGPCLVSPCLIPKMSWAAGQVWPWLPFPGEGLVHH